MQGVVPSQVGLPGWSRGAFADGPTTVLGQRESPGVSVSHMVSGQRPLQILYQLIHATLEAVEVNLLSSIEVF